jgi:acetylornithine aminotransferase
LLQPGQHGTTFGGNPIACAAAHAVLNTIATDDLISRAKAIGERITATLGQVPGVRAIRGAGALQGVVLTQPVAMQVEARGRALGVIVNAAQPDVLRLAPPLTITDRELDSGLVRLAEAIVGVGHD